MPKLIKVLISISLIILIPVCIFVYGADHNRAAIKQGMDDSKAVLSKDDRFEISRVQVFKDDLAYDNQRAIYVLKDKQTGKEFVGISGIGISELGQHTEQGVPLYINSVMSIPTAVVKDEQ